MRRVAHCVAVIVAIGVSAVAQQDKTISAAEVLSKWREAVHAPRPRGTALLGTTSNQDGIPGQIEEWVAASGEYRRVVKREFDEEEFVVTDRIAQRRDWNGFVRVLEGEELSRLRTAIFETEVLAFGPDIIPLKQAKVTKPEEGGSYALTVNTPGGKPITWSIDRNTGLPTKSVRPGEDSEITTTYSDWRKMGQIVTPVRATVAETNKPDYSWERVSLRMKSEASARDFAPIPPGPMDAHVDSNAPAIPFNFDSAHILFKMSVNGRPPLWFILDTGADQEVLNSSRLAEFGLKPYAKTTTTGGGGSAKYDYVAGVTLTAPGVELRNQHVAAIDSAGLEAALGVPLGGLLGYDFISRFVVDIDYQKKLITLHDPKNWNYQGSGIAVPIVYDGGIPFTHGAISVGPKTNIPAFFVIDFGAAETMTLTSPFVRANDLTRIAVSNATVNRPAGLEKQFFAQNNVRGHIDQLTLDALTVHEIPINMSVNTQGAYASKNFSGTIGEGIYHRYHIILDYARNRVIFEPTAESDKPFPERQVYGLSLLASGPDLHTYTVAAVRPDSPAAGDGFKKGDVIAAMDNAPAAQFTLAELRDHLSHAGEHHVFEVMRGGQKMSVPVDVKLVSLDKQ